MQLGRSKEQLDRVTEEKSIVTQSKTQQEDSLKKVQRQLRDNREEFSDAQKKEMESSHKAKELVSIYTFNVYNIGGNPDFNQQPCIKPSLPLNMELLMLRSDEVPRQLISTVRPSLVPCLTMFIYSLFKVTVGQIATF